MGNIRYLVIFLMVLVVGGCEGDIPHRTSGDQGPRPSYETVSFRTREGDKGSYDVAYVEFDDQGWFQDMSQRNLLLHKLHALADKKQKALIVVYAHGWQHNAGLDDENVAEFKNLLGKIALFETLGKKGVGTPRRVVGVYLGWRGESISLPLLKVVTFWTRKNAAERVGERSVKQVLMELNQFRAYSNGWPDADRLAGPDETQLIMIGHSFGGLVMYNAIQTELMDRALEVNVDGNYKVAKSFGDFVLLVNPAFEGAAFEPLWRAAVTRGCYPVKQRPIMAIVTSQTDLATDIAFPLGRLYTYLESAPHPGERETVLDTVGHLDRYTTHVLSAVRKVEEPDLPAERRVQSTKSVEATVNELRAEPPVPTSLPESSFNGGRLDRVNNPEAVANLPYLVISAKKEMIDGHSDIWNPRFRNFMFTFIMHQVMQPVTSAKSASCPAFL